MTIPWLWSTFVVPAVHFLGALYANHTDLKQSVQNLAMALPKDVRSVENFVAHPLDIREDPEVDMDAFEIIRYHGYPVEEYDIVTTDGYILTTQRIPYGKKGPGSIPRKPVIVQHGFLADSTCFVFNTPDKNLAYILAEAGYDVWITNSRGNRYGKRHIRMDSKQEKFWKFSLDEMGQNDLPDVIDFVLKKTGFNQTNYVGHSMGVALALIMLATKPEYNAKLRSVMAMAPAVGMTYAKVHYELVEPFLEEIYFIANVFGYYEASRYSSLNNHLLGHTVCKWPTKLICSNIMFLFYGIDEAQMNMTRLPVYVSHLPSGGASQCYLHYCQIHRAKVFQAFDYGKSINLEKYGQPKPPPYNLSKVTTPIAMYWTENDFISSPQDNAELASKLKSLKLNYRVPVETFNHLDFLLGMNVKELVYNKLLRTMAALWPDD